MLVVGLTGGIGCGKSEVRRGLVKAGITVIDADTLARSLTETNEGIKAAIKEAFGEEIYDENDQLRSKRLAKIVFHDRKELERLNGIIHPRVISTVERQIEQYQAEGKMIVVVEAALHYEVKWDEAMDLMVVVAAPLEKRIKWVQQRDLVDEEAVRSRMKNQLPLEEKVKKAHYVIENDGDLDRLQKAVEELVEWLTGKAQQN